MSTVAPDLHPVLAGAIQSLEMGRGMLLNTFKYVPEDKLNWSPSGSAKSALRIVAHCAVSNFGIAGLLRGEDPRAGNFQELMDLMDPEELKITTREQAVEALNASTEEVKAAIAGTSPVRLGEMIGKDDLMGPCTFYVNLPGLHMSMHSAQIDYLETCWSDGVPHFRG